MSGPIPSPAPSQRIPPSSQPADPPAPAPSLTFTACGICAALVGDEKKPRQWHERQYQEHERQHRNWLRYNGGRGWRV